jgi:hypothetical protein
MENEFKESQYGYGSESVKVYCKQLTENEAYRLNNYSWINGHPISSNEFYYKGSNRLAEGSWVYLPIESPGRFAIYIAATNVLESGKIK